jgi:hypothetical protein
MYNPDDVLAATLFPQASGQNVEYLRQQFAGLAAGPQTAYIQAARQAFENSYSREAQQRILAMQMQNLESMAAPGMATAYLPLATVGELSSASPHMQNFIMAHPNVGKLHDEMRIDGYAQTYRNPTPGLYGHHNPYYRAVTNGMLVDIGDSAVLQHHYEDDPLVVLDQTQREVVLCVWQAMEYHLSQKELDPTSPTGSEII